MINDTLYNNQEEDNRPRDIYLLICPIENIVRYVGISVDPKERFGVHCSPSQEKENEHKFRWIQKLKKQGLLPELKVIAEQVEKKEAERREVDLIAYYKSILGEKLTNIHKGGGLPPAQFGDKNFLRTERGRKLSSERNSGAGHPNYGLRGGESFRAEKVDQYNINGDLIKTWPSIKDAERELFNGRETHISAVINGRLKRSEGFVWRFSGETFDKYPSKLERLRCVEQLNKSTGEVIKEFQTIRSAALELNIADTSITKTCKNKRKSAGGFGWRYKHE